MVKLQKPIRSIKHNNGFQDYYFSTTLCKVNSNCYQLTSCEWQALNYEKLLQKRSWSKVKRQPFAGKAILNLL